VLKVYVERAEKRFEQREEDGRPVYVIDLPKNIVADREFVISIVYESGESSKDMGMTGSFKVFAPEVAGLEKNDNYVPVINLTMQLWLLKEYMYFPLGGNMRHLTGQPRSAWSWLRGLFFPPDTNAPFVARQLEDEIRNIRRRSGGGEMSHSGERLSKTYLSYLLLKGKGGAWASVTYMSPNLYYILDFLFFLAGAFGLYALGRWTALSRSALAVGGLVLAAFMGAALPSIWQDLFNAVFLGAALTSIIWLAGGIFGYLQSRPTASFAGIPTAPARAPLGTGYGEATGPEETQSDIDILEDESPPQKGKPRRGRSKRKGGE